MNSDSENLNFVKLIKEGFKKHKPKCSSNIEFVIKDMSNIDEFLVGFHGNTTENDSAVENTKTSTAEATKLFDSIDMVIADGEANYLPWSSR